MIGLYGGIVGMDVGKVSHITVGKRMGEKLHVLHLEKVRQDGDNLTGVTFIKRFLQAKAVCGVIDSQPDVSIVKHCQARLPADRVWGARFTKSVVGAKLNYFEQDEDQGVVTLRRTPIIDLFVKAFNEGKILFPKGLAEEEEIKAHLRRLKRITDTDKTGEEQAVWISTNSEDHWAFSLLYLFAAGMMTEADAMFIPLPASVVASKTALQGRVALPGSVVRMPSRIGSYR